MSRFTRIRTLTVSAFFGLVAVAPGCDDARDYEALGVAVQDLEGMSAEELDALDAELDTLVAGDAPVTHTPRPQLDAADVLMIPLQPTHAARPQTGEMFKIPPRPTHGEDRASTTELLAGEPEGPEGCDTHGDDVEFAAG